MKKKIYLPLLMILCILTACTKSKNDPVAPAPAAGISANIVSGTWIITSFNQRTEDKTSLFNGYTFSFLTDGVIKAEKNGAITTGTWAFASAVTYYGVTTPVKSSFTINFGNNVPLDKISKTWNIDSTNTSSTRMAFISPEPVENMHLNFAKQ